MPDLKLITHAGLQSLVARIGCYDAVASIINARWGSGATKGTISKKMNGGLDWSIPDLIALEDVSKQYPGTFTLARRLENRPSTKAMCLVMQSGLIAKETGEAINAILAAEQSLDAADGAQAIREIDEAIAVLQQARATLAEGAR